MDLKKLRDYLVGLGDPLTLSSNDGNLPTPFRDFLNTIPAGSVTLSPGPNGITLSDNDSLLTVTGPSTDTWPVQGMTGVTVDLSAITLSITIDTVSGSVEGGMNVTSSTKFVVTVTSLTLEENPWRIQLKQDASGANALELLLLGNVGTLPFDIPPALESDFGLGATALKENFAITFYPNTEFSMYYSLGLEIQGAQWTPIEGVLSFNGISLSAFIKEGSISVVLSTNITIGTVGMTIGVSMNRGTNWTAFVRPTTSEIFPGPVDLANWALGQATGTELTTSFDNVDFDLNAFGLAISKITLGFNWKTPKVNFLKITSLLTVKALKLDVVLTLPMIEIYGSLHKNEPLNVITMLESFGLVTDGVPTDLSIDQVIFNAQLQHSFYQATMEVANIWHAGPVSLKAVKAMIAYDGNNGFSGSFESVISINNNGDVVLSAAYGADTGWLFTGRTGEETTLKIGDMIAELTNTFGIPEVPPALNSLTLKDLFIQYGTKKGDFSFSCTGYFTVSDTQVEMIFTIDVTHTQTTDNALPSTVVGEAGYSATFGGSVKFSDLEFQIIFNIKSSNEKIFIAYFINTAEDSQVKLKDLIYSVSPTLAGPIPTDISIGLNVVKFAFLQDSENNRHFLFGVELGANIGLTDIPLIGDKLPEDASVEFNNLQFAYAKPDFNESDANQVNPLFPEGVTKIPKEGLQEGVLISSNLQLGTINETLSLTIPTGSQDDEKSADTKNTNLALYQTTDTPTPPVGMSIDIQKQFGPVGIQKVGLEYKNKRLFVVGDITLTAQILSIGLLGLGIGSKVSKFAPAATLDGLTITVEEGPLAISGGLYGSIHPLNLNGLLMVEVPSMTIGALGGYAQIGDDPSFFMYLSVNRPLVGYPFFFLNGIAGGLGFNRDLKIPDIDGVAAFPLVSWSMGINPPGANPAGNIATQVDSVLQSLAEDIPPQVGEYWIAAGIKFSSFEILNSFALVTMKIGTDFKMALLGLTTASLPPNISAEIPPLGYVEMALKVAFSPDTGILEVDAKLTPASYILSKGCHITGGFAYYMWFKDNPDNDPSSYHAGDFVVTLGGYNPAFVKPKYYPSEPLLGLNWTVDPNTTIKGGIYFAMTPSTLMAGGRMEAVWKSGDLKAWFTAYADFLLSWKPFHYEAGFGLTIGASYVLDLWVTTKTITVHIGVDISLWGPSFGGKIYVDLTVISFTVKIGNQSNPTPQPIDWHDFKKSFLPKQATQQQNAASVLNAPIDTETYCLSSVSKGMIKDLSSSKSSPMDPDWILNAEKLELVTMTAFPTKTANLTTAGDKITSLPVGATDFGVGPVNVSIAHFASEHLITINRIIGGKADKKYDVGKHIVLEQATSYLPSGTWGGKLVVSPSISTVNNTPQNIGDLVVGYSITTKPLIPDHAPLPIDISILQQESEGTVNFIWATPDIPTTDPFDQSKSMETFMSTLTSEGKIRGDIIQALIDSDLDVDPKVNIEKLAQSANTILLSPPILSYLGEEREA